MTLIIGTGLTDAELAENAKRLNEFAEWWTKLMRDHPGLKERYEAAVRDLYEKRYGKGVDTR